MHISITENKKTDGAQSIQAKNSGEILKEADTSFSKLLKGQIEENKAAEETLKLPDIDYIYNAVSMDINDALFFINLAHEGQFTVNTASDGSIQSVVQTEIVQTQAVQKSAAVTNQVVNLIEQAQKTQKPVRISFDNDISVVLKIDKKGKVSAEFIPGSIEAEKYLTANVSMLKQRFDEQNLPYSNITYRKNSQTGGNDRNSRSRNENKRK